MKNNCDVSGSSPLCEGFHVGDGCEHFVDNTHGYCIRYEHTHCNNMAAIRAAIESERVEKSKSTTDDGYLSGSMH